MPILHAHSFLVHPGKNDDVQVEIGGVALQSGNMVFSMLSAMYDSALAECDIEIMFRSSGDEQVNRCRTLLVAYALAANMQNGRAVAERLQAVTTHRSGLGLFFLAVGSNENKLLMISRFPANQGVVAEEIGHRRLDVAFVERVFMKNAHAYKSAVYAGPAVGGGFWRGHAVDKQINETREISNYWIGDFLDSELATTGPAGTKRIAVALRSAIRKTVSSVVRDELMAATRLMPGQDGRLVTAQNLAVAYALSPEAIQAVRDQMPRKELFAERFRFDRDEFRRHLMYRSIELDNGAVLTAENGRFDQVFRKIDVNEDQATYTTTGSIVTERLNKTL